MKKLIKKILLLFIKYVICRFERRKTTNLDYSLWGLEVNKRGHLVIGGCNCVGLAEKYGTPIHVVDRDLLKKNYNEFYESFKSNDINFGIYYSYKTNPIPAILKVLHESGAGAEVISPYELWLAFKLGVSPDLIIYNGPNKSDESLKVAIENRIKLININSFNEIEKIKKIAEGLGIRPKVGVRICISTGWGSQFGFKIKSGEAFNAFEKLSKMGCMEIEAIHTHLGTDIKRTSMYEKAIGEIFEFVNEIKDKLGVYIKYLDLGGGFGVSTVKGFSKIESKLYHSFNKPYLPPNIEDTPSMRVFAKKIASTVCKKCKKYKLKSPVLLFEPGRVITSNVQMLLAKVCDLKEENSELKIAIADAGINIASPVSWEYHEIFVANKMNSNCNEFYKIAGPICTPIDILYRSKKLPLLEVGDIIAIMDSGAYYIPFSNNFSFTRPAVVMVSEGKHWVVREKESFKDMIHLDEF
ncbi:MAG: hypothetical protein KAI03_05550 [Candidatus Aureabacteria bacterium]|nr:hypothetical protein [Candidatus Auribacterota bacterium]